MRQKILFGFSILLLLIGGMLYLFFRPKTLLLFSVAEELGMMPIIDNCRDNLTYITLPDFVVYCLPNGLWSAAYILSIDSLMTVFGKNSSGMEKHSYLLWTSIIPLVGVVSELLQYMGVIPGTFDWGDIACYAIPYMLYVGWKLKIDN